MQTGTNAPLALRRRVAGGEVNISMLVRVVIHVDSNNV